MRDYQLKIEPFEYVALQEVEIHKGINCHADARIVMRVKDDQKEEYLGRLSGDTWIKVIAEGEERICTVLFQGLVTDFAISQNGYETMLSVKAMSGTVLMDNTEHYRVFQNKDTETSVLFREITSSYAGGQVSFAGKNSDTTEGVLIQYRETDWVFLKRLAAIHNQFLVADCMKNDVSYTVGMMEGAEKTWEAPDITVAIDVNDFQRKSRNGLEGLRQADMAELTVRAREIYRIGDFMVYEGRKYYIHAITTRYQGAECVHEYRLKTKEALRMLPMEHKGIAGCAFDATVTAVSKDTVQIDLAGDEWKALDGRKWFSYATVYSSPDGTGWYSMPEEGDAVRLYVPDKEGGSLVISSVHKETDSARQNPEHKSFKTKYGKEILFTPDSIMLTNNQGMMVEMNDAEGITITSDKDIAIQAEGSMTIASGSDSLLVAAENIVQVKQSGTTMTLSDDIYFTGGEFRIQ